MTIKIAEYVLLAAVLSVSACSGKKPSAETATPTTRAIVEKQVATGLETGQRAPELSYNSPDGKTYTLSSLRGQLVLIDFWASWCMPCRVENPNLVNVYLKYKDKKFTRGNGFTVYSVSLDTDHQAWTNGIAKDGLVWKTHVSDLQGWKSVPAAMYQVDAIPANFLIDGEGIIIAKNLRAEALGSMMESLLKQD